MIRAIPMAWTRSHKDGRRQTCDGQAQGHKQVLKGRWDVRLPCEGPG